MALNIGALVADIELDTRDLKRGRRDAEREFGRMEKRMQRFRAVALRVGAALAAAFAAAKLAALGREAINTADQIGKLSQALGVSTEFLSEMRHAVELSGASFEEFTASMRQFSRIMSEAISEPTSRAARAFEALGVSLTDAQGRTRDTSAVIMDLADAFAAHADGANKTAIAMALFGDAGARLIPLLNSGSAGIREMREEAHRLGLTLDREATENAARFNDAWTRIQSSTQGFVNIVMKHLLPILERISVGMQRFTQDGEKMKMVSNAISAVMTFLASVLAKVGAEIHGLVAAFNKLMQAFNLAKAREFSKAWEAGKEAFSAYTAEIKRGAEHIDALWEKHRKFKEAANEPILPNVGPAPDSRPQFPGIPGSSAVDKEIEDNTDRMRELHAELDLVLDRLNGLPNLIGEAYTVNVTGFQDAMAAIDQAVMKGVMTQQEATRMKLMLTEQEQNAYKRTAQVAAQAITTLFPKSKAAAIAAAIINTAVAVTEALKLPPPLNFVQAGLVAAAGAAQIATIRSTNMNGGGSSRGVSGGGSIGPGHPYYRGGENPQGPSPQGTVITIEGIDPMKWFNGEAMRELAEKLVEVQKDGATVVFSPT